MVNKKSRGSARTGNTQRNYQIHGSGGRFSGKKIGLVTKTTRHSEIELSKQKDEELFDDGRLPSGISLSSNKKNRWMIPEIVEERMAETFLQNHLNDRQITNQDRKSSSTSSRKNKKRKSQSHDDKLPLKSVVIERHLLSHKEICKAVYSATGEEYQIKKGKSWKCKLTALMEDSANDYDILYEIESGTPSKTWPFNYESFTAQNALVRKREKKSSWLKVRRTSDDMEIKAALNECYHSDSFDNENYFDGDKLHGTDMDTSYTEFRNDARDMVTLADFCFPKKESLKRKRPSTASSKSSFAELKPCNPASTEHVYFHGKNSMVYVESDGLASAVVEEESLDTKPLKNDTDANAFEDDGLQIFTSKTNNDMSGFPLKDCQECKITVDTSSISEKRLFETYGNNYIESKSTPRKFAIILDQRFLDGEISNSKCLMIVKNLQRNDNQSLTDLALKIFGYRHDIHEVLRCIDETERLLDFDALTHAMLQSRTVVISPQNVPDRSSHLGSSLFHALTKWIPRSIKVTEACDLLLNELFTAPTTAANGSSDAVPIKMHPLTYACGICYETMPRYNGGSGDSSEIKLKQCLHAYCKGCWDSYLVSKINESARDIKCPTFGCQAVVDMVTIMSIVSPDNALKHLKTSIEGKITDSKEWEWCPSCERAAFCSGFHGAKLQNKIADLPVVLCPCLKRWCFHCKETCHWPAHCDDIALYKETEKEMETVYDHSGKLYTTDVYVKRCPKCSTHFEKIMGCNSMVCRCGMLFCWNCLKPNGSIRHFSGCLEVQGTVVEFTSLDTLKDGHGKIIRKAHKFNNLAYRMKQQKRNLGLDIPSYLEKRYPLRPKQRLIKDAIEFHEESCNICENLTLTRLASTSKYYSRRLFRFIDTAEALLNSMIDTIKVPQMRVDLVDVHSLNIALFTLKTHMLSVKRIGS